MLHLHFLTPAGFSYKNFENFVELALTAQEILNASAASTGSVGVDVEALVERMSRIAADP